MKIETNSDVEPNVTAFQDSQVMMATPSLPVKITKYLIIEVEDFI